jgi:HSP20 family protein
MLMRFDPFRELDALNKALATAPAASRGSVMAMDAYRDGDRVVVHLDLPGVDPESIELTIDKNVLTVTAERTWDASGGQDVIVSERPQGRFTRQLFLGDSLDADRVEATYDRGVLTLVVPVAEHDQPRRVPVLTGSSESIEASSTDDRTATESTDAAPAGAEMATSAS